MLKSVKATVDEQLASDFHQLQEQKIHKIHAAMEVHVYRAETITTRKCRQFHVCLNRARQVATKWLDADQQSAKEQLEYEIHQVTPVNASFSINSSNIMSDNYRRKLELKQPDPEAHSAKNLFKWKLLQ